jgi:vancomycin permeability regulator SanA
MAAAVAFYQAGKVKAFIVSGDNATHQYDEAVSTVSNRKVLMPKTSLVNLLPLLIPENSWLVFKL